MTITERVVRVALSLVLAVGSFILFGDGLRLIAEWRVDALDGIFMLCGGLLGTIFFAYRAEDVKYSWPLSITGSRS